MRRALRWCAIVAAAVLAVSGGAAVLVRWSIAEHDRLMAVGTAVAGVRQSALFTPGQFGDYSRFRVPAIVRTKGGDLLVFAEGRASKSDHDDIALIMRRSPDNGASWTDFEVIHEGEKGVGYGLPAPILDEASGVIWLAYWRAESKGEKVTATGIQFVSSSDDGRTWSEPVSTLNAAEDAGLGQEPHVSPSPGDGIQLQRGAHEGRLLLASYVGDDSPAKVRRGVTGHNYALYSDDQGKTWAFGEPTDYGGEASLVENGAGDVLMVIRSRGLASSRKKKRLTWSKDGGRTWTPTIESVELSEPVCQGSMLRLASGGLEGKPAILFMQPGGVASGRWDKSARKDLTVWMSKDEGVTWPIKKLLHGGGASYSDMASGDDGRVHVVFEVATDLSSWSGAIHYASFDPSWIDEHAGSPRTVERAAQDDGGHFSERVYDTYQELRAPLEEAWKDD